MSFLPGSLTPALLRSRFKVLFYVIVSEKSKSGPAFCSSRQQNQRRGEAVWYFRCTDTVSGDYDLWWNIGIQLCHHYTDTSLIRQVSESLSLYSEFQKAHYFLSEQRKFSTLLPRVLIVYSFVTHLSISSVIMLTIKESQIPKKRDDQPMGRVIMPVCADHIA